MQCLLRRIRDGLYRHADAEHDSGEHALVPAFAEGEHQTANDDGDEIEVLGNRPCEGRFGVAAPRSPKGFRPIAEWWFTVSFLLVGF
jgi:hypothetical protein